MNMRERKYVKLRVDMYEDTKLKIIDRMPERDVIHYVWTRIVVLAGKVNLEGNLYMSKNIPYTVETLAIEFNREVNQVKLALDTFIELEMVEITEKSIYKVKNFTKHQNIKAKEKVGSEYKAKEIRNEDSQVKRKEIQVCNNIENEKCNNNEKEIDNKISDKQNRKEQNIDNVKNVSNNRSGNLEIIHKDINEYDNAINNEKNNLQENIPILLEVKKSKKATNKKKKKEMDIEIADEDVDDASIISFYEGNERPLIKEESVIGQWSF